MTSPSTRIAPRSAATFADTAILRVALTDILPPVPGPAMSLAGRLRAIVRRLAR